MLKSTLLPEAPFFALLMRSRRTMHTPFSTGGVKFSLQRLNAAAALAAIAYARRLLRLFPCAVERKRA